MNITIDNKTKNPLLAREEVLATITFEGETTPSRKDIQQELAKKLKSTENTTIIKQIKTLFGSAQAKVTAYAYSDEKVMLITERKNLVEKHAGREPKEEKEEGEQ